MGKRIGGTINVAFNGKRVYAKGEFEWRRGSPKKTTVVGVDGVHGYTEQPQAAMIKGTVTVVDPDEQRELVEATDATVTVDLGNGQTVMLRDAHQTGEGNVKTNEGEMEVVFEGEFLEVD